MRDELVPLRRSYGYLPIEDHGLIGDGTTAALVGRDGAVSWLCLPRFDSPPVFCGLLDADRGGDFRVAPETVLASRQTYIADSGVLVTELLDPHGRVRITDALTLRRGAELAEDAPSGRGELLRRIEVLEGRVRLRVRLEPRGGAEADPLAGGLRIRLPQRPELPLHLSGSLPLDALDTTWELEAGARHHLALRWGGHIHRFHPFSAEAVMAATIEAWQRWLRCFDYQGPEAALVRRSAITLKLLDYTPTGAIVAAPTSSLPEAIGGPRNWDYRYAWIRDAAFSVYALRRVGLTSEAASFLGWVVDAVERHGHPKVLYDLDGRDPPPEREDPQLAGYRGSAPVRWGNGAAAQHQHDVFGEILDCVYQWARWGGTLETGLWVRLHGLVEAAARQWHSPDHGIWEVRTAGRPFTYSAALCAVALERGAELAERFDLPGEVTRWRAEAQRIRQAILEEAWDPRIGAITEHLGGGGLDASVLTLPLRRLIPADHPKMVATVEAVRRRLDAGNGLLYRYLPEASPDGIAGHEGAFLLCSFWLVDNLALQGRPDEAMDLFQSLCARASPLGLLAEEIDPGSGAFLGNFPQAFSHVGVIASGVRLARLGAVEKRDQGR